LKELEKVIDFVSEWDAIITDKVEGEMEEVNALHKRFTHYYNKVDQLRSKEKSIEDKPHPDGSSAMPNHCFHKGVISPHKLQEKLIRNEAKLDQAWKKHEARATHLCNLLEEVVGHEWELLHHLVRLVMKFETTYAANLNRNLFKLSAIMEDMTETFNLNEGQAAHGRGRVPNAVEEYDSDDDTSTDEESAGSKSAEEAKDPMQKMMQTIKA